MAPVTTGGQAKLLISSAKKGDDFEVRQCLKQGLDPDYQHPEIGTTPLVAAVRNNQLACVKVLVEEGKADINLEAEWFSNGTPLDEADKVGAKEIVAYLEGLGAKRSGYAGAKDAKQSEFDLCAII